MATIINAPNAAQTLVGIDPTTAERWDDCPGKYEAVDIRHLPSLAPYSSSDTGLTTHAAIHRLNHALLDSGTVIPPEIAVADALHGHRFDSELARSKTQAEIGSLVDQYLQWRAEYGYRLIAAELNVTTTAQALPGNPGVRVYLSGRLDFLGLSPDGAIAMVDFKTGPQMLTGEELAVRLSSTVYVLLALHHLRRSHREAVEAVEVGRLSLRAGAYTSKVLSLSEIRHGQERIKQMALDIAEGRFALTPGNHCNSCPRTLDCLAFNADDGGLLN